MYKVIADQCRSKLEILELEGCNQGDDEGNGNVIKEWVKSKMKEFKIIKEVRAFITKTSKVFLLIIAQHAHQCQKWERARKQRLDKEREAVRERRIEW